MEATLTPPKTNLELKLNGGEITQNKQLTNSEKEASKPGTNSRTSLDKTCTNLHKRIQDVGGVTLSYLAGGKDPPKNDPATMKNQRHTQSQNKLQPKSSKFRR